MMKNYKARKTTVFKKAKELSTLCGVDVALILYGPGKQNPDVWCSKPNCLTSVLTVNNQHDVSQSLNVKERRGNEFIRSLGAQELKDFTRVLSGKIDSLNDRINQVRNKDIGRLINVVEDTLADSLFGIDVEFVEINNSQIRCAGATLECTSEDRDRMTDDFEDVEFVDEYEVVEYVDDIEFDWTKKLIKGSTDIEITC